MFSLVPRSVFNDDDDLFAIPSFSNFICPRVPYAPSIDRRFNKTTFDELVADPSKMIKNGKFQTAFDVRSFDPNDIKVKLDGNYLQVEAKQEKKSDGHYEFRQFVRNITIPEEVAEDQLKCKLDPSGRLHFEAPLKKRLEEEKVRDIPIEMVKNNKK